jgi:hypothetical protein
MRAQGSSRDDTWPEFDIAKPEIIAVAPTHSPIIRPTAVLAVIGRLVSAPLLSLTWRRLRTASA